MRNDLQCPDSVEVCLEEDILVQRRDEKKLSTTRSNLDEKLSREDSQMRSLSQFEGLESPKSGDLALEFAPLQKVVRVSSEDNKVENWDEQKVYEQRKHESQQRQNKIDEAAEASEATSHLASSNINSNDPVEQDQMHALLDNQTSLMRIMDRDRNRIQKLEARIKELQEQLIQEKSQKKAEWVTTKEVMINVESEEQKAEQAP